MKHKLTSILVLLLLFNPSLQGAFDGTNNASTESIERSGDTHRKHHKHHHKKKTKEQETYVLKREIHKYRYHISIITALTTIIGAWYKLIAGWKSNSPPCTQLP